METRLHYIQCTVGDLQKRHIKRMIEFSKDHKRLRTVKIIYDTFLRIMRLLQNGVTPPDLISNFDYEMDRMIMAAWREYKAIGWDQILKGRLSKKWRIAQWMYYHANPDTRECKYFNDEVWIAGTIMSFVDSTLGL